MPAAACKADLLSVAAKEFAKLETLLDKVPNNVQTAPDSEADNATLKDIVGHRAHWIALFLGWYDDGQDGKDVAFPAPGYKWNDLKRFNADLRSEQADLSWADAREMLRRNHAKLVEFVEELSEDALYGGPMTGANNK